MSGNHEGDLAGRGYVKVSDLKDGDVIIEKDFRKYIRYGFVLVNGKSGATYQIFRNMAHTKVWKGGKLIEEICVRIKDKVPPTDNVIAFKVMIESDELAFKKIANVYPMQKAA